MIPCPEITDREFLTGPGQHSLSETLSSNLLLFVLILIYAAIAKEIFDAII